MKMTSSAILMTAILGCMVVSGCKQEVSTGVPANAPAGMPMPPRAEQPAGVKVLSVAEYMHDIDAAVAQLDLAQKEPTKWRGAPSTTNASAAYTAVITGMVKGSDGRRCWPKGQRSTATTDHACLDEAGYKR